MKKNMIALIAGAAALCIMAAGCGSQTTGTAGSAAASTASTADAAATTAAAEETPAWQEDDTAYLSGIKASDYVELPDGYKHQEVEVAKPVDPTDEEVEDRMNLLVKNNGGALEEVSRSVQKGDTVSIDYVGKIDGKEFEGGTGSYDLQIGSGAFIEGFEDGLIGAKKGETLDLNLKFPDDYPAEDVAGKTYPDGCMLEVGYHYFDETGKLVY
jgi:trigger factor